MISRVTCKHCRKVELAAIKNKRGIINSFALARLKDAGRLLNFKSFQHSTCPYCNLFSGKEKL